jgi:hypothetical protein
LGCRKSGTLAVASFITYHSKYGHQSSDYLKVPGNCCSTSHRVQIPAHLKEGELKRELRAQFYCVSKNPEVICSIKYFHLHFIDKNLVKIQES